MTIDDLVSEIFFESGELDKAKYYFEYKGIELHSRIKDYLQSFLSEKVQYSQLATAFRYDKKIRKALYKYIGLFEEHLRAYICNKYSDNYSSITLNDIIKNKIDKYGSLYDSIDDVLFSVLVEQVILLPEQDKLLLFPNTPFFAKNLRAIVKLRNAVCHSKFLLNNLSLGECTVDSISSSSLRSNLKNFCFHLDDQIGSEFIKEIEECKIERITNENTQKRRNQTKWVLLDNIIIDLSSK